MRWRTVGLVLAVIAIAVLAPAAVGAPVLPSAADGFYTPPTRALPDVPDATIRHDRRKPTAVIVVGNEGANAADVLAPYEVLAASGAFNLYIVAEHRRLVPLVGGLDVVPDLSFDGLDRLLHGTPDVIVVPQIEGEPEPGSPVVTWLRRERAKADPLLVSVCVGAETLAEAGFLTDRPATSHWLGLIGLRRSHPEVNWRADVRYVDDGDVITSAGVLSGIDGALRVVERFAGQRVAARAADAVHWPLYSPGKPASITPVQLSAADTVGLLSATYRWHRPRTGVLLTDGVGETELASAFRSYTELSYLARPISVTVDGNPIRSRHGLTFVPRSSLDDVASQLERLIVPGAKAARERAAGRVAAGPTPVYLHRPSEFAFDGTLRDIARSYDVATARWVAKTLQYPAAGLDLSGSAWPWSLTLRPLVVAGLAVAALLIPLRIRRRRGPADADQEPPRRPPEP